MSRFTTQKLTICAMLTALVALVTFSLPVPTALGYIHLGDSMILLSAMLLGPVAALVGGIGSALADLISGYAHYVLPTLCIKAAAGAIAGMGLRLTSPRALPRYAIRFVLAELVMVAGYTLYHVVVSGWAMAIAEIPPNLVQAGASVGIGCALFPVAQRIAPLLRSSGRPL